MSYKSLYEGKTVLVTGHTGFKGAWLSFWLKMLGARVVGYSLPPEPDRPNLYDAAGLDSDMHSVINDIRNLPSLVEVFERVEPEVVFHMAAQSLVRPSYGLPVDTYGTNVMGTVHVLEAVRLTGSVRAVLVVTSDKCYENREWVWGYRENESMGGHDPYSSSKGCAELVASAYRRSFFLGKGKVALATARAGNVIGGGDWAEDRLVPDIVRALVAGEKVVLRNPDAVRPWQHVLDPLRGYLMVGEHLLRSADEFAEAWNFGPSDESAIPVMDLARKVVERWGKGEVVVDKDARNPHEAHFLRLDSSKARLRLGWSTLIGIEESVDLTVQWYRKFYEDPARVVSLMRSQIEGFMEKVRI